MAAEPAEVGHVRPREQNDPHFIAEHPRKMKPCAVGKDRRVRGNRQGRRAIELVSPGRDCHGAAVLNRWRENRSELGRIVSEGGWVENKNEREESDGAASAPEEARWNKFHAARIFTPPSLGKSLGKSIGESICGRPKRQLPLRDDFHFQHLDLILP